MRDIKTLLEVLLDQYENNIIDDIQVFGLCWAIKKIFDKNVISEDEYYHLDDIINNNCPNGLEGSGYWWRSGATAPRIEFLKQLIKKYEIQCQNK